MRSLPPTRRPTRDAHAATRATRHSLAPACLVAAAVLGAPARARAQRASDGAQQLAPVAITADPAPRDTRFAAVPLAVLEVQSPFRAPIVVAAVGMPLDDAPPVCASAPCRVRLPPGRYYVATRAPDSRLAGGRVLLEMPGVRVRLRGPGSPALGIGLVLGGALLTAGGALLVALSTNAPCAARGGGSCGQDTALAGYLLVGSGVGALVTGAVLAGVMGRGAIAWRQRMLVAAAPFVLPGAIGVGAVARF